MHGSHAAGTWEKLLEILLTINKQSKISSLADIACGLKPIELEKISDLSNIKNIFRLDGDVNFDTTIENRKHFNVNKVWPLKKHEVDFAFATEIIEHA